MIFYRTNHCFYLRLLLVAVLITLLAVLFPTNWPWFTIITGIGCGGISSVCVAWMIEYSNCKSKNRVNEIIINRLFLSFDYSVENELRTILTICAGENKEIFPNKEYSIQEIQSFLEKADGMLSTWEMPFHNMGVAFYSMEPSVLMEYDPLDKHVELYNELIKGIKNHQQYEYIKSFTASITPTDTSGTFEYTLLTIDLRTIARIYSIRNSKRKYTLIPELLVKEVLSTL